MATLSHDKTKNRWRLFYQPKTGRRRGISLGSLSKQLAEDFCRYTTRLEMAAQTGDSLERRTAEWVAELGDVLHAKLANAGLVPSRVSPEQIAPTRLGPFLDSFMAKTAVKQSTKTVLSHTKRNLIDYFTVDKPLEQITEGDGDDFRAWLIDHEQLSPATVDRRCGIAKQFLRAAVRRRLIAANPFADLKSGRKANDKRDYFLSREDAAKIFAACPDHEWKLIFALSRFGGLRCPSEHLGLRWGDIDWANSRFTVHSPKTEHHEGGESRVVPLFPELRQYLEAAWDAAEEGAEYCITRYRDPSCNLRTQFNRIIKRAGLTPWEKLFANLRASRATELAREFPGHVAAAWLGHTEAIARKHYWQVTDEDFDAAAKSGAPVAQNLPESSRTEQQGEIENHEKTPCFAENSDESACLRMGVTGLEPVTPAV